MKKLFAAIMVLFVTLSAVACVEAENQTFTIAFLPNEATPGELDAAGQLLVDEIQKALGDSVTVTYVLADDYSVVTEAILTGTAQIAWESGATFARTNMEDDKVIPLVTYATNGDLSLSGYNGYIATNIDNASDFDGLETPAERLGALVGKSFAFVSATSTSGRLVPTTSFWNALGPDGTGLVTQKTDIYENDQEDGGIFSEIVFAGTHQSSAIQIYEGSVYAGAFCCNYGSGSDTQGNPFTLEDFYIISQALVPNGPLWVNSAYFTQSQLDAITDHLVGMNPDNAPEFFDEETGFFFEYDGGSSLRFIEIDNSFYDFVRAMYAE